MQNRPVLRRFDGGTSETAKRGGAQVRRSTGKANRGYERQKDRYRNEEHTSEREKGGRCEGVAAAVREGKGGGGGGTKRAEGTKREERKARARTEYIDR